MFQPLVVGRALVHPGGPESRKAHVFVYDIIQIRAAPSTCLATCLVLEKWNFEYRIIQNPPIILGKADQPPLLPRSKAPETTPS